MIKINQKFPDLSFCTNKIQFIFEDKNIKEPSDEWLSQLLKYCLRIEYDQFCKGIDKIVSIPQDVWNTKYGFRGRPSIVDFIEVLAGERPLSDEDKLKAIDDYKKRSWMNWVIIKNWLDDRNLDIRFKKEYIKPENCGFKEVLDSFCNIKSQLSDLRIMEMGRYLKSEMDKNLDLFRKKIIQISERLFPCKYQLSDLETKFLT